MQSFSQNQILKKPKLDQPFQKRKKEKKNPQIEKFFSKSVKSVKNGQTVTVCNPEKVQQSGLLAKLLRKA